MDYLIASGVFAVDCSVKDFELEVGLLIIAVDDLLGQEIELTGENDRFSVLLPKKHPPIGKITLQITRRNGQITL